MTYHHGERMTREQIADNKFSKDVETNLDVRDGLYNTNRNGLEKSAVSNHCLESSFYVFWWVLKEERA
jgi:hypothetical protein